MALTIAKILVPVDFSEISLSALDYAGGIAKITGAQIILLHVMERYESNEGAGNTFDYREIIELGIGEKIEEVQQSNVNLKGVKVVTKVTTGKIHTSINEVALKEKADLIVMGTSGSTSITQVSRRFLGSNAYRALEDAPCPILTISKSKRNIHFKDIVLPIDSSKETVEKVDLAIEWARIFESRIHIVAVMAFMDELSVDVKNMIHKVEDVSRRVQDAGVPFEAKLIRQQSIASAILEYADHHNADMIMIVSSHSSVLSDIVFRNDARIIVMDSPIPVLSINLDK
jgi:nucleotide-binding universal stress UspA family protein